MTLYLPDHEVVRGAVRDGTLDFDLLDRLDREHTSSTLQAMRADPVAYFSKVNRNAWTGYLGIQDGPAYTRDWARLIVRQSHDDKDRWPVADRLFGEQWPLPVGRAALEDYQQFCEQFMGRKRRRPIVNPYLLPFDGTERAMAIVESTINGTRVEAFGLVVRAPGFHGFHPDRMEFRVAGDPRAVTDFCDSVQAWWTYVGTQNQPRGRHKKQLSYDVAAAAWFTVRDLHEEEGERRKPTQQDVCDFLSNQGIAVGTTLLGQHIKRWRNLGRSWPPADQHGNS